MSSPSHIKIFIALLSLSLFLPSVVSDDVPSTDLIIYSSNDCNGNRATCSNVAEKVCCLPPGSLNKVASGLCLICSLHASFSHYLWSRVGDQACGQVIASDTTGACLQVSDSATGYSWCHSQDCQGDKQEPSHPPADALQYDNHNGGGGGSAPRCTSTVKPDLLEIDGMWFGVNSSVPKDDAMALWNLWGEDYSVPAAKIPEKLLQYMVPKPEWDKGSSA